MKEITKYIVALILFCFVFESNSFLQTLTFSKETEKIVRKISKVKYIFVDGEIPVRNIKLAKQLMICATDKELYKLIDSNNQIVICFSCWVLAKKKDNIIVDECNKLYSLVWNDKKEFANINKIKKKSYIYRYETVQSFVCNYLKFEKYLKLLE